MQTAGSCHVYNLTAEMPAECHACDSILDPGYYKSETQFNTLIIVFIVGVPLEIAGLD